MNMSCGRGLAHKATDLLSYRNPTTLMKAMGIMRAM